MIKFEGEIKGFPQEVVEKMLERQVEQGKKRDITVFEDKANASTVFGGFNWSNTIEGVQFWLDVIDKKLWEVFFDKYPKDAYPKVMLVSDRDDFKNAVKRVVFMEKNKAFIAWTDAETLINAENVMSTTVWRYAKDLPKEPEIHEVTLEEISKAMNIPLSKLRIKK